MAAAAQQRVERVAIGAFEPVTSQFAVVLHVPDRRLDGAAAPDVAPQAPGDVAPVRPAVGGTCLRFVIQLVSVPFRPLKFARNCHHFSESLQIPATVFWSFASRINRLGFFHTRLNSDVTEETAFSYLFKVFIFLNLSL